MLFTCQVSIVTCGSVSATCQANVTATCQVSVNAMCQCLVTYIEFNPNIRYFCSI